MKDGYKYFVMREEWQVVLYTRGNDEMDNGSTCVELGSFPNKDAAFRFREYIGVPHNYLADVWVPLKPNNEYERLEIRRADVRVS